MPHPPDEVVHGGPVREPDVVQGAAHLDVPDPARINVEEDAGDAHHLVLDALLQEHQAVVEGRGQAGQVGRARGKMNPMCVGRAKSRGLPSAAARPTPLPSIFR